MPFNGPIDGNYENVDFTKGPWKDEECMTLTHSECVQTVTKLNDIEENFDPAEHDGNPVSDMFIHSDYNKSDWQYAINWKTFLALRTYDPEVNKDGIDGPGIVGTYEEPEGPAE
jgi:hypothetical protein